MRSVIHGTLDRVVVAEENLSQLDLTQNRIFFSTLLYHSQCSDGALQGGFDLVAAAGSIYCCMGIRESYATYMNDASSAYG